MNYIALGFTWINTGGFTRPQCVICAKVLSHNSIKPSLLGRHVETKHAHLRNKPQEFFESEFLTRVGYLADIFSRLNELDYKGFPQPYSTCEIKLKP